MFTNFKTAPNFKNKIRCDQLQHEIGKRFANLQTELKPEESSVIGAGEKLRVHSPIDSILCVK